MSWWFRTCDIHSTPRLKVHRYTPAKKETSISVPLENHFNESMFFFCEKNCTCCGCLQLWAGRVGGKPTWAQLIYVSIWGIKLMQILDTTTGEQNIYFSHDLFFRRHKMSSVPRGTNLMSSFYIKSTWNCNEVCILVFVDLYLSVFLFCKYN